MWKVRMFLGLPGWTFASRAVSWSFTHRRVMAGIFRPACICLVFLLLGTGYGASTGKSDAYKVNLDPLDSKGAPRYVSAVILVGGGHVRGRGQVAVKSGNLEVRMAAWGWTPSNDGGTKQAKFDPVERPPDLNLFYSADGVTSEAIVSIDGTWTTDLPTVQKPKVDGTPFYFTSAEGQVLPPYTDISVAPGNYSLVLAVAPYPYLSDFLYASAGALR